MRATPWWVVAIAWLGCESESVLRERHVDYTVEESVDFGAEYVGVVRTRTLRVSALGNATLTVSAAVPTLPEVHVDTALPFELTPGEARDLQLTWTPEAAGTLAALLNLTTNGESAIVSLIGEATAVPTCDDDNPCTHDSFDLVTKACRFDPHAEACDDGSACTENDVCVAGTCMGTAKSCDDGDACSLDYCATTSGCHHDLAPECSHPCYDAACDASGCSQARRDDGVPCGAVSCAGVPLCAAGQCELLPFVDAEAAHATLGDFCPLPPDDEDPPPPLPEGACSPLGWCWENPTPQGNWLRSVYAIAPDDVWAVGHVSTAMHFDGETWTLVEMPPDCWFTSVFAFATDDVFVAGRCDLSAAILHWDGMAFTVVHVGQASSYNVLHGRDGVLFAGAQGRVSRFDGNIWQDDTVTGEVRSLWVSAADDVWLVTSTGNVQHFDGETYSAVAAPASVIAVTGDTTPVLMGVGAHVLAGEWSALPGLVGTAAAGWQTPTGDLWAVGYGSDWSPALHHWDGEAWTDAVVSPSIFFASVHGTSDDDIWMVGGAGIIEHWAGTAWQAESRGALFDLRAISGSSRDDVWAVSSGGNMLHRGPLGWSTVSVSGAPNFRDVYVASPTDAWAVSHLGLYHWDGAAWTLARAGSLWDISANAPDDIWFAGDDAVIVHYDGEGFTTVEGNGWDYEAIWASSASDIWTADGEGMTFHFDGEDWAYTGLSTVGLWSSIWGAAPDDIWFVGGAFVGHFDGESYWQAPNLFLGGTYGHRLVGRAPDDIWAVGPTGLAHYDGTQWTIEAPPAIYLRDVWMAPDESLFVVGDSGVIVRRDPL